MRHTLLTVSALATLAIAAPGCNRKNNTTPAIPTENAGTGTGSGVNPPNPMMPSSPAATPASTPTAVGLIADPNQPPPPPPNDPAMQTPPTNDSPAAPSTPAADPAAPSTPATDPAAPVAPAAPAKTTSADAGTGAGAGANAGANPDDKCGCGYVLSAYENSYYPYRYTQDFSTMPDKELASATDLPGWKISDNIGVGGQSGTYKGWGSYKNVKIQGGNLVLTVPKYVENEEKRISSAEAVFDTVIRGGVFLTTAQVSNVPGSVQAFWTNHIDETNKDEQDIEILSKDSDTVWFTNWNDARPVMYMDEPTNNDRYFTQTKLDGAASAYHNYTIGWYNDKTLYYLNGKVQDSPPGYYATHDQYFVINNWSNNGWPGSPTTGDIDLKVSYVDLYYKTDVAGAPPSGCTIEQACKV